MIFIFSYGFWQLEDTNINSNQQTIHVASIQPNMGSRLSAYAMVRDQHRKPAYSNIELSRTALQQNPMIDLYQSQYIYNLIKFGYT